MPGPEKDSAVRPERVAREITRILEEVTKAVDFVVAAPHPTPESLHRLHRQMRKLRTGLALWEALLPSAERDLLHPLDVRVKRLSRLVGRIRDRDIALGLLQRFDRASSSRRDIDRVERYRKRVQDDARTGRELLRAFLRSERQARLLDDVGERLRSLPRSGSFRDSRRAVALAHARTHDNLARAHRKALRRPTMQRLHRLRIRIRRARQFSDLAVILDPAHERAFPSSMVRLQKDLGDLHDLDMILVGLEEEVRKTVWAKRLRDERRRLRKEILRAMAASARRPVAMGSLAAPAPRKSSLPPL
ncbi:MAG TPA: CHAD domain-containing protein [Thermoplasmata archaeon]|nr:CHAD domain-containing protein [Thermoplasmata archaeon]